MARIRRNPMTGNAISPISLAISLAARQILTTSIGRLPRIAQQSYLLITENDFAKAAGLAKVMVEGRA